MTLLASRETGKDAPPEIQRRLFTYAEFDQMSDLGLFADQHVELLEGELIVKGMQSPRHAYAVTTLNQKWLLTLQDKVSVVSQVPLVLLSPPPDFVEPDILFRTLPAEQYATRNADNRDAITVIEISDSTLERDQSTKLRAYARNGIRDYWIYNLHTNQLEVMREPSGEEYLEIRKYKVGQSVATLEFPEIQLEWWV
jgi:Uma2 family endonuclease